jgi:hypothetical protein
MRLHRSSSQPLKVTPPYGADGQASAPPPAPPSVAEITASARWLAQALDANAGAVRLVDLSPQAYRAASFLDDRIFQSPVVAHVVPWAPIAEALQPNARCDARWIFHIGHVGSTLISRLLGELDSVLAVREPRILRDLALVPADRRPAFVEPVRALLSRTFVASETALVKATSFVSELAAEIVPAGGRALFLYVPAPVYIATILAGESSRQELRMLAASRAARLEARAPGVAVTQGSDADLAAVAWACEMTALEAAAEAMATGNVHWRNFDSQLGDMHRGLVELASFFGFRGSSETLEQIAGGPLLSRYSKALEYDYSPALRREVLAQAERTHRPQIRQALAMLESGARGSRLLARALERC